MSVKVDNIATKVLKVNLEDNEVSFAIKADITNFKDSEYSDEDVTVEIQGVDADGFEIISIYLSGKVPFNTTKTLTDREDYQDKDEFDQVVRWQYTN
ncbi:hypothetical protein RFH95_13760 [Acinetobacter nosocomialis]|uniref:hypothetical protein n=1 Tax=Acinetobacter calcoaceticus/baumannii complex TaxID=909768 RepID=UPI0002AEDC6D|nr:MULTISPECIES: hypothetical protein [Acinetobacter calcoaceticus/baumannii complex]ELW76880.1 hypothetical protein ACIN5021_1065 [Acinetobacter sp. OIFC021]EXE51426.1 hypothetical protein J576_1206 [Acinetobacter sp. 766875]MBD0442882.1 hypothetical protein [Acinetobacter nosocomialis]MDE1666835.1 hypothetical protein [Acinetobacter nosocomialis]MDE1701824.1 hypothetical protein [Acinetobacter nosocomialis]